MSASWVAGSVRAKAMARRRLGRVAARSLAATGSLDEALAGLAPGPYGDHVRLGQSLAQAQHAIGDALLWNVRVLAGWLPAAGAQQLRVLAGWFEIANVDELLGRLDGRPGDQPYRLGRLATAWPQLAAATSTTQIRDVLAASSWGDPRGDSPRLITLGLRLAWARRVAAVAPPAARWSSGGVALLVARELFAAGRRLPGPVADTAAGLLGVRALAASSLAGFAGALPVDARWALAPARRPDELWIAEAAWWSRLRTDATVMVGGSRFGPVPVLGACALLAADAWRVGAALELASRGGGTLEVSHGLA